MWNGRVLDTDQESRDWTPMSGGGQGLDLMSGHWGAMESFKQGGQ